MPIDFNLTCVLFDLDGTLVDTAPDIIASLNTVLQSHGFEPVTDHEIKPYISFGAAAMIKKSLQQPESEMLQTKLLEAMLKSYEEHIADKTRLYDGMSDTLDNIESKGLKWGVITNKRARFTQPLMQALQLTNRAACIISGDSTAYSKPHPEPMYTACRLAHVNPHECIYIGDAAHDIEAGKRAEMKTLVARYGYLKPDDRPENWGADALIDKPSDISSWIDQSSCH